MTMYAHAGYTQMRKVTASPRQIEAELLTSITADLEAAVGKGEKGFPALVEALHRNTKLWTALVTDLASDGNALDAELRARLISLGTFSIRFAQKVLTKEEGPEPLININRAIAAGLRGAVSEAA